MAVENQVKLFGMTGQLITQELSGLEKRFSISLGHEKDSGADKDETYYPQFEGSIRSEAKAMAEHYELFFCLEKSIRAFISETLNEERGEKWWDSGAVPTVVYDGVKKRIQKEIDSGVSLRSNEPIDFTNFGELGEIIKSNWEIFGSIFNSQRAVESVLARLNTLRGPIAHCSNLAEDEILRLKLSVRDWFRLME